MDIDNRINKDVLETQRMLQLAAAQRMNIYARGAIFCIIMSGEDVIDAFKKLIKLDLSGNQVNLFPWLLVPYFSYVIFHQVIRNYFIYLQDR